MQRQERAMAQINLIATIEVSPEVLPAAAALLLEYGEIVATEPGNLRFEVYRDPQSGSMVVVERYASAEAFEAHLANPANEEFNAELAGILGGGGSTLQMLDTVG